MKFVVDSGHTTAECPAARRRSESLGENTVNLSKSNSPRGDRNFKRIPLQICLTVTGRDEYGSAFVDQVLTENVSKDGGCLLLSRDLRRTQSLGIKGQNGTRFLAEVSMVHVFRPSERSARWLFTRPEFQNWLGHQRSAGRCLITQ